MTYKIGKDVIGQTQKPITAFTGPSLPNFKNKTETMAWIDKNYKDMLSKIGDYEFKNNEIRVYDKESDLWIVIRYARHYDLLEDLDRVLILLGKRPGVAASDEEGKITYRSVTEQNFGKFADKLNKVIDAYKRDWSYYHSIVERQRKEEEERKRKIEELKAKFPLTTYTYERPDRIDGILAGLEIAIVEEGPNKYRLNIKTRYDAPTLTAEEIQNLLELIRMWGIPR